MFTFKVNTQCCSGTMKCYDSQHRSLKALVPFQIVTTLSLHYFARFAIAEQWGNSTWSSNVTSTRSLAPSSSPSVSQEPSATSPVSTNPSSSPSIIPSISPTFECHDQAKYRSPINSLNCSQHNGTDCFEWRHLGLSPFEVEVLINSCPISCNIACGALFVLESNLTFHLLELDNFLSPETTILLEEATSDYLTDFILERNETSRFLLNAVELLSQRRVETSSNQQNSLRLLQGTESHVVDLEVSFRLNGFFLELSLEAVEDLLEEGIDTFGYMRALRFTNDPALQYVEVRLHVQEATVPTNVTTTTMTSDHRNASRWKVLLTVFSITGIFCVFAFYILKKNKASVNINEKIFDAPIVSPVASMASSRFALVANLSQDSAVRFASIDVMQRAVTPTSFSGSSESGLSLKMSPNTSLQSISASADEEHPLAGVIPPMIVYNNIESTNEINEEDFLTSKSAREKIKLVVPYKMVTATNSFRIALKNNSLDALDKSTFAGIQNPFHASDASLDEDRSDNHRNHFQLQDILESGSTSSACTLKAGAGERDNLNCSEKNYDFSIKHQSEVFENRGFKVALQVPRVGKLGLVIQCPALNWPSVLHVKEYSSLYREILPGDRILSVDGDDMYGKPLEFVTESMKGTNDSLSILIWRPRVVRANFQAHLPASQNPTGLISPSSHRSGITKDPRSKSIHSKLSPSRSNFSRSDKAHRRSSSAANQTKRMAIPHRRCLSGESIPASQHAAPIVEH